MGDINDRADCDYLHEKSVVHGQKTHGICNCICTLCVTVVVSQYLQLPSTF